ncbi:hypothetical protein EMIT0P12_10406 [Pseudomonas sp. IT-P12]
MHVFLQNGHKKSLWRHMDVQGQKCPRTLVVHPQVPFLAEALPDGERGCLVIVRTSFLPAGKDHSHVPIQRVHRRTGR